jgi:hypothetical protein
LARRHREPGAFGRERCAAGSDPERLDGLRPPWLDWGAALRCLCLCCCPHVRPEQHEVDRFRGAGADVAAQRSPRRQLVEIGAAPVFLLIFTGHCGAKKIMREACLTFGVRSRLFPLHFACICSDATQQQDSGFPGILPPGREVGARAQSSASPFEWFAAPSLRPRAKRRRDRGRDAHY